MFPVTSSVTLFFLYLAKSSRILKKKIPRLSARMESNTCLKCLPEEKLMDRIPRLNIHLKSAMRNRTAAILCLLVLIFGPESVAAYKPDAKKGAEIFDAMNCSMCHPGG